MQGITVIEVAISRMRSHSSRGTGCPKWFACRRLEIADLPMADSGAGIRSNRSIQLMALLRISEKPEMNSTMYCRRLRSLSRSNA